MTIHVVVNVMKFNIIGFSNSEGKEYKHCVHHPGTRLQQDIRDPDKLYCPECGISYLPKESGQDENILPEFGPRTSGTKIIQGKKEKKQYDSKGNLITDPEIAQLARKHTIVHYSEFLPPSNVEINTGTKNISRKRML